jgi:hypothetical protein
MTRRPYTNHRCTSRRYTSRCYMSLRRQNRHSASSSENRSLERAGTTLEVQPLRFRSAIQKVVSLFSTLYNGKFYQ